MNAILSCYCHPKISVIVTAKYVTATPKYLLLSLQNMLLPPKNICYCHCKICYCQPKIKVCWPLLQRTYLLSLHCGVDAEVVRKTRVSIV
jgi:hypothetical protein